MRTMYVRKIADADGKIRLEVPVGKEGTECGVTILVADEPSTALPDAEFWDYIRTTLATKSSVPKLLPEGECDELISRGSEWLPGFLDRFRAGWQGGELVREVQGENEQREPIK